MPQLSAVPELWESVDPHTQQDLAGLFLTDIGNTTPGTGLAALMTAAAVFIQENFHSKDWGPVAYDLNTQLQTMLSGGGGLTPPTPPEPEPVEPAVANESTVEPAPAPAPRRFTGGVIPGPNPTGDPQ